MGNVFADFLQNQGLYDEITISKDNIRDLIALIGGEVKISVFCKECGEKRVFAMEPMTFYLEEAFGPSSLANELEGLQLAIDSSEKLPPWETEETWWMWKPNRCQDDVRIMTFSFVCTMDKEHHLDYVVITNGNIMKKIGQYPSVADLSFPELEEYSKVISKEDRKELGRALGLYASGIGAGSYVYLRRIFERILEQAKAKAIEHGTLDVDRYEQSKVVEKIKLLKEYLPEILNDNTEFYGIVSKGIHELSEDECREYFPVLKDCILLILQQWEQMRKEKESVEKITKGISKIASNLK